MRMVGPIVLREFPDGPCAVPFWWARWCRFPRFAEQAVLADRKRVAVNAAVSEWFFGRYAAGRIGFSLAEVLGRLVSIPYSMGLRVIVS